MRALRTPKPSELTSALDSAFYTSARYVPEILGDCARIFGHKTFCGLKSGHIVSLCPKNLVHDVMFSVTWRFVAKFSGTNGRRCSIPLPLQTKWVG